MHFSESLDFLNSFLNLERFAFRPDNRVWNLDRMRALLERFDHPEKACRAVVIAGTKGKGSTGYFIESILQAAGRRTGFYSSPHLETPLERIRIGGRQISQKVWVKAFDEIRRGLRQGLPKRLGEITYFEIMALAAALAFRNEGIETAIYEAGLGGRLDAANAMGAKLAVLTPIAYDHEDFLGSTLKKIAGEKADVIARKGTVITTRQAPEAMKVIRSFAKKRSAELMVAGTGDQLKAGLTGAHQKQNAGMALEACQWIAAQDGFKLPDAAIRRGLGAKHWPGRFEQISGPRHFLLDVAHNPAAIRTFVKTAESNRNDRDPNRKGRNPKEKKGAVIFGVTQDKRRREMFAELARAFDIILPVTLPTNRAVEVGTLLAEAREFFPTVMAAASIEDALETAIAVTDKKDRIAVTGSFYLVGPVRSRLKKMRGVHVRER